METLKDIISERFTWGLIVGLVLLILSWKSNLKEKRYLKKEIKRLNQENAELQNHLGTQLKINAKGNEALQSQLDELREQNETLRVNIHTLQQKPGKTEMRKLEIMETAVSSMREQAPGFAAAWEKSMRDAEDHMHDAESGLKKLIHKVIPSFRATPALASKESNSKQVTVVDAETSD